METQSVQHEESIERQTKTEEKLVQQQVTIQELHDKLKVFKLWTHRTISVAN